MLKKKPRSAALSVVALLVIAATTVAFAARGSTSSSPDITFFFGNVHVVCNGTEPSALSAFVNGPRGMFKFESVISGQCVGQSNQNPAPIKITSAPTGVYHVGVLVESPSGATATFSASVMNDATGASSVVGPFTGSGQGALQVAGPFVYRVRLLPNG